MAYADLATATVPSQSTERGGVPPYLEGVVTPCRLAGSPSDAHGERVFELEPGDLEIGAPHGLVLVRVLPDAATRIVPFAETARIVEPALPLPLGRVARRSPGGMDERTSA